jgi:monoamine oxidase
VIHARDTRRQFLTRVGRAGGLGAAFVSMRSLGLLADSEPVAIDAPPDTGVGTKVVVLGGGIGGLVTAYELRRAGFDCTLLEARPAAAPGRCAAMPRSS